MRRRLLVVWFAIIGSTAFAQERVPDEPAFTPEDRQHWSFTPPKRGEIPTIKQQGPIHPVDAFVLARLEKVGLQLAPEADRATLIRRLSFDLTGLPPTPADVDAFVADKSSQAYSKVVDRLLASPHYGERWGQHWLDLVRFAESNGYELDVERQQAWRYRDYVIRSLNADKTYDRFLTEQLAGDELAAGKDPKTVPELLIATGMQRCGPTHIVSGNLDLAVIRQENLTEMVNGVGAAVLGLTVGCARCHDHKFDPVSQADYYRMQAFFAGVQHREVPLAPKVEQAAFDRAVEKVAAATAPLKEQIRRIEEPYQAKLTRDKIAALDVPTRAAFAADKAKRTAEQKKLVKDADPQVKVSWDEVLDSLSLADQARRNRIKSEIAKLEDGLSATPAKAWASVAEEPTPPTHVLKRGDPAKKASLVHPGFPRVFVSATPAPKTRLELARWLTHAENPLTARVIVNRLWQHHFGRGIVATPNDFGIKGELPSHPELLDWLACELVTPTKPADRRPWTVPGEPWSLKRMHKLIVTSATYRQASAVPRTAVAAKVDPENRLLWRQNRKRLEAEAIRDAMLTAAGTLNREVGGPSVKVPLEPEVYDLIFTEEEPVGLWKVTADPKQHTRRSVYLFAKRNVRLPLFEAFDQPDTLSPCAMRGTSTFAPQALILMNGPLSHEQSRQLAKTLLTTGGPDDWTRELYRRAFGRSPREQELKIAREFLSQGKPDDALADLCLAVFNANEFVHVP